MSVVWNQQQQATSVDHDDAPPLKFERRQVGRWPMEGVATAFGLAGDYFGEIHDLQMCDYGHGGMCAVTEEPIQPGLLVSVGFQQPGVIARRGVVRRCDPCGHGYRVAIEFQMRQAA